MILKTRKIGTIKTSIITKQKLDIGRYQSTISYINVITIITCEEETTWGIHRGWWRTYDNGTWRALIRSWKQKECQKILILNYAQTQLLNTHQNNFNFSRCILQVFNFFCQVRYRLILLLFLHGHILTTRAFLLYQSPTT